MKEKPLEYASKKTLDGLREFDSATVFNAVVGSMGGSKGGQPEIYTGPEIRCMLPELGTAVGYAVTAEVTTNDPDSEGISWNELYDAIHDMQVPVIEVFKDVDSRPGRGACVGEGMASVSKALGVVGYVVDGSVRDLMGIRKVGVPVWAKGVVPGHGALRLVRVNTSVTVGSLRVHPGEIIVADTDGCTKIPLAHDPAAVLEQARKVREIDANYIASNLVSSFSYEKWKAGRSG
jgi:regulator of RNase E activity RraA